MPDLASYGLDNIDFGKLMELTVIEAGPRILGPLPIMRLRGEPSHESSCAE